MHHHIYLITLFIATLSFVSGCNGTVETSSISANSNSFSSQDVGLVELNGRKYYVAKPQHQFSQQKAYKLLLAFHGSGQGAKSMKIMANFEHHDKNYIVVYPQSQVEEWNEGCDCNKPHRLGIDDLSFVEDVVADVKNNYNIIDDELYAVGYSQGGLFTQNLMCNSSIKFKAIASVASPMSKPLSEQCQIENKTNYLLVHGTSDRVLPYNGVPEGNFALIGSEKAIDLIAKQNDIETSSEVIKSDNLVIHTYKNDRNINRLVSVEKGHHAWSFENFDTSIEVINFFNSVSSKPLDKHSSLYRIVDTHISNNKDTHDSTITKDIHVRSMGLDNAGPAIVLLSGFNKNYHADSAWFSLLQPLIAETNKVHVIERLGNGFSSYHDEPSQASFASLLDKTLVKLDEDEIIIVTFSSGNVLAQTWYNSPKSKATSALIGMLWVDPDILLPHSISLYQDWPVAWYREAQDKVLPHIEAGNWTERTISKLVAERLEHSELLANNNKNSMDWAYYDLISQSRTSIEKQLVRAKEIINYHSDLELMLNMEVPDTLPISVIDTDFESVEIENAKPDSKKALLRWQQEGSEWSKQISERSGGRYIPLENSDHMVVFQHPKEIIKAVEELIK